MTVYNLKKMEGFVSEVNEILKDKKRNYHMEFDKIIYSLSCEESENVSIKFQYVFMEHSGGNVLYIMDSKKNDKLTNKEKEKEIIDVFVDVYARDFAGSDSCNLLVVSRDKVVENMLSKKGFIKEDDEPSKGTVRMVRYEGRGRELQSSWLEFLKQSERYFENVDYFKKLDKTALPLKIGSANSVNLKQNGMIFSLVYGRDDKGLYWQIYKDYKKLSEKNYLSYGVKIKDSLDDYFKENELSFAVNAPIEEMMQLIEKRIPGAKEILEKIEDADKYKLYKGLEQQSEDGLNVYKGLNYLNGVLESRDSEFIIRTLQTRESVYGSNQVGVHRNIKITGEILIRERGKEVKLLEF